jgi:DNA modification methylase
VAYKPNSVTEYILVFQKPMNGLIDKILKKTPKDVLEKSLVKGDYERTNIWRFNPETKSEHPAPFPIELPQKLIEYYSFVGDIVLDPLMGSGTTCLAAKNKDRKYIGIEKKREYFDIAEKRLA